MSMTHDEMIAVIQAEKEGKIIQLRPLDRKALADDWWLDVASIGPFNFVNYEYRIKPEPPKPREWWINICPRSNNKPRLVSQSETRCSDADCDIIHVREVLPEEEGKA